MDVLLDPEALYRTVPKGITENLRYRRSVIASGYADPALARQLCAAAASDVLWWINTFVWTFNPRHTKKNQSKIIPFVTWEFQDDVIRDLEYAISEGEDRLIEKTRDMGVSWIVLVDFLHHWMFDDMSSFLLGSRKEEYVDKAGDPKSLFWKIDFALKNLPGWMVPDLRRNKLHLHNNENGATIDGESTNQDFARGDRRTAIALDEFAAVENGNAILAATADVTNCRIYMSTHKGVATAFNAVKEKGETKVVRLHWTTHPIKAKGIYRAPDGKMRSPWYDAECKRRLNRQEVAQEIDIDVLGSDYQYFDPDLLHKVQTEQVFPPYSRGDLDFSTENLEFRDWVESPEGRWKLWMHLDDEFHPPRDRDFSLGADISAGQGASDSALVIVDAKTGEKVAEYANNDITPDKLADLAIAACKWFGGCLDGAFLIWEENGPGQLFGKQVVSVRNYGRFYLRRRELSLRKRTTDQPGWWTTPENKIDLLGEYRRAMGQGQYQERSEACLAECRQYIRQMGTGAIVHTKAVNSIDPAASKDNHGDLVVASALAWYGVGNTERKPLVQKRDIPVRCLFRRREERRKAEASKELW